MINGKTLGAVLAEIQVPAPELMDHKQDKTYYPIEAYENRLQNVVGLENYTAEYSAVQHIQFQSGQSVLCCTCTLKFFDENRDVAYQTQGIGTSELIMDSEKGRLYGLNNAGYICQLSAFKSACKAVNIFGLHGDGSGANKGSADKKADPKEKATEIKQVFYTEGAFSIIRTDARTDKPVYKVQAHLKVGETMTQSVSEIIFYPNQYKRCVEKINNLNALCADGKMHRVSIKCTRATYETDIPQYIFKGFC